MYLMTPCIIESVARLNMVDSICRDSADMQIILAYCKLSYYPTQPGIIAKQILVLLYRRFRNYGNYTDYAMLY